MPLFCPIRATCPAHLILLDFITQKILVEDYESLSSSLCSFLHSLVTSSLLGPNNIQNYRPISIISVFAKLLERSMLNRWIPLLYENKILTEAQNGFRKGKCIETAVQSFIEIIQDALDKGVHSIGIFIDITKAYDTLNHTVLSKKLSSYGIRGIMNL